MDSRTLVVAGIGIGAVAVVVSLLVFFLLPGTPPAQDPGDLSLPKGGPAKGEEARPTVATHETPPQPSNPAAEDAHASIEEARKHIEEGRFELALEAFTEAERRGADVRELREQAEKRRGSEGKRKAERLEIEGDNAVRMADHDHAADLYRDALDRHHSEALELKWRKALHDTAVNEGDAYLVQEHFQEAVQAYQRALEALDDPGTREKLGAASQAAGASE